MPSSRYHKSHKTIPAKPLIVGVICGILSCVILIALSSLLITKSGSMPDGLTALLMIILTCIGTFIGGYISGKVSREKGMLYGMACGFAMFVIFFLGGFAVARNSVTMMTAIRLFTMLLAGTVGGITGVNKV